MAAERVGRVHVVRGWESPGLQAARDGTVVVVLDARPAEGAPRRWSSAEVLTPGPDGAPARTRRDGVAVVAARSPSDELGRLLLDTSDPVIVVALEQTGRQRGPRQWFLGVLAACRNREQAVVVVGPKLPESLQLGERQAAAVYVYRDGTSLYAEVARTNP